ncbi:MAG: four-carbon acid sugar kinase family protein [Limisphaerales bacterium]
MADDLSGAAELAGVARGYRLRSEVHTRFDPKSQADVIAVDTDSRSLTPEKAAKRVRSVASEVVSANPDWIYKKTDSVLRGNILTEIEAICEVTDQARSLFIPANPGKQRVILRGHYGVEGKALNETAFAQDPQYPANTSLVADLLQDRSAGRLTMIGPTNEPGPEGVFVPDAWESKHLVERARSIPDDTLPAGAAEFFSAILEHRAPSPTSPPSEPTTQSERHLFVCGSQAGWATSRRQECFAHHVPIVAMPRRIFEDDFEDHELDAWAVETIIAFEISPRVMLAIGGEKITGIDTNKLTKRLIDVTCRVLRHISISQLYLEGGATAAALIRRQGWNQMNVHKPVAFGLADLEVIGTPAPLLTIKPGSYPWPDAVWGHSP